MDSPVDFDLSFPSIRYSVAMSSDGTKIVTTTDYIITTSNPSIIPNSTVGTSGAIIGVQNDTVRLQYIGNNTFNVLSHEGYLEVK